MESVACRVRYPEYDATAAMVGHGAGVLGERVELEGVLRLLELDILAFFGVQQLGYGHQPNLYCLNWQQP